MRARLQRLAASRRALPPLDDNQREHALRHWESLSADARCEALRFDDQSLVQRVHGYMDKLVRAELWAASNGLGDVTGGSSSDGSSFRLQGFGFEVDAERDCLGRQREPIAFGATEEFAANEALVKEMQEALGSPLLEGRPALQKQDWLTVFEETPVSWQELQAQVYRLVELALLHAFVEAGSPDEPSGTVEEEESAPAKQGQSASAKRRMRKKKNKAAQMQSTEDAQAPEVATVTEANQQPLEADDGADMEVATITREEDAANSTAGSSTDVAADAKLPQAGAKQVNADPKQSRSLLMPTKPKRSLLMPSQEGATCFAWLPSLLGDGSTQWRWKKAPDTSQPEQMAARAFVKNTFLDVEWMARTEDEGKRKHRSALF
mmetsp:Transcript_138013/g.240003  ORF Transcript_138013/g.240003 Transcript_138013/m.240003 type:complete len:378 (+) Transcript_138013:53-1186(+)